MQDFFLRFFQNFKISYLQAPRVRFYNQEKPLTAIRGFVSQCQDITYQIIAVMKIPAFDIMPNLYHVVKHANTLLLHKPLTEFVNCYLASNTLFFLEQVTHLTYLFPIIHICTPAGIYLLKVNNKDTRTMASFWCLYC